MDILRGDIFYNKKDNIYLIITDCVYTTEIHYVCMAFDGYKTLHCFIDNYYLTSSELEDETIYNQVGGIY